MSALCKDAIWRCPYFPLCTLFALCSFLHQEALELRSDTIFEKHQTGPLEAEETEKANLIKESCALSIAFRYRIVYYLIKGVAVIVLAYFDLNQDKEIVCHSMSDNDLNV